ncbi:MAG: cadherin-like domain-containing protein [Oscillospiraceae bacterium]|nr:cadherin-like domain-containing protein [Oscillospiraceae bacterium]
MRIRFLSLILALTLALGLGIGAAATEVDCDSVYCFNGQEFSAEEEPLAGICITGLPSSSSGTVLLGIRVIRAGDILTADQIKSMTFNPLRTEEDAQAVISYLPIYADRVEKTATMTIGIRGKEDKAPLAEDLAIETYKNLPNDGVLKATDPEGEDLTFTIIRGPKRGSVEVKEDGTFVYTPKKNKVGIDSFTYTATDPAGNVSRVATVTVQILKPTDSKQYTDTVGHADRFEAEWLRNSGLFVGEQVGGNACFYPEKEVSRGEFLAMVVKVLDIPLEGADESQMPADAPQWLKPYLAAAQRSGLLTDLETAADYQEGITGAEVAVILQNALDLTVSSDVLAAQQTADGEDVPTWAAASLTVMEQNGVALQANAPLTRADAACVLYQVSKLALEAPGMTVIRMQQ